MTRPHTRQRPSSGSSERRSGSSRRWRLQTADCLKALPKLPPDSVDAIVTDPPYGLKFMGKEWDRLDMRQPGKPTLHRSGAEPFDRAKVHHANTASHEGCAGSPMQAWHAAWAHEALRVLKPGGHLLAFGGTRTFHRLACALEDAGFEIRDCMMWLYGSGFPKSMNVALAIDKATRRDTPHGTAGLGLPPQPQTPEALAWTGWGTALKPAWEPIVIARKPPHGTIAQNVLAHATGALNIDGCRIDFASDTDKQETKQKNRHSDFGSASRQNHVYGRDERAQSNYQAPGRWPANLLLSHTPDCQHIGHHRIRANGHHPRARGVGGLGSAGHRGQRRLLERSHNGEAIERWACTPDCPARILDDQSGVSKSTGDHGSWATAATGNPGFGEIGGASRFFYCAKASRSEREAGLDDFPERVIGVWSGEEDGLSDGKNSTVPRHNVHPTVKPLALMRYLVRLITPPGGTVLDPFAGSGTTGAAAVMEGAHFLGIEREPEYVAIARARIRYWASHHRRSATTPHRGDARN